MKTIKTQVPQKLVDALQAQRPQRRKTVLKIYKGFMSKQRWINKDGYFEVSSNYLKSIYSSYEIIVDYLKELDLLEVYRGSTGNETYSVKHSVCKKYKLINQVDMVEVDVEFKMKGKYRKLDSIIQKSLENISWNEQYYMKRDQYSQRLHHNLTNVYKRVLPDYYAVDASACQPTLMFLQAKENGFYDRNMEVALYEYPDFYQYIADLGLTFGIKTRDEAKDLWQRIINAKGKEYKRLYYLFPTFVKYLDEYKNARELYFSRKIQKLESKLFIDDMLINIADDFDFIIPIHDSFIVHPNDAEKLIKKLNDKYGQFKWKAKKVRETC